MIKLLNYILLQLLYVQSKNSEHTAAQSLKLQIKIGIKLKIFALYLFY